MTTICTKLVLFGTFLLVTVVANAQFDTVKVMAWNILHGANDIPKGRYSAIDIIKSLDPDIILMVETYGSGKEMADTLDMNFHLIAPEGTSNDDKSVNLSILSKFPFGDRIDTPFPFYLGGREIIINGKTVRFFSNWFHYDPWDDQPEKMGLSAQELLKWEKSGTKWAMFEKVLPYLRLYSADADSFPVIIGGDMNTPSHLDWTSTTSELHDGLVVPWQTTQMLEDIGLIDSYRQIHPNPQTHPGITWDVKDKIDEHRIDYIYYKGPGILAIASESYKAPLGEMITISNQQIPYPSDHGLLLTTFIINR